MKDLENQRCAQAVPLLDQVLKAGGTDEAVAVYRRQAAILLGSAASCHEDAHETRLACDLYPRYQAAYRAEIAGREEVLTSTDRTSALFFGGHFKRLCGPKKQTEGALAAPCQTAVCPDAAVGLSEPLVLGGAGLGLVAGGVTAFVLRGFVEDPNGDEARRAYLTGGVDHLEVAGYWLLGTGALMAAAAGLWWWLAPEEERP